MKKIILLLTSLLLSCDDEKDCCSQIPGNDTLYEFSIINNNGEDLLDENTQDTYNTNSIRLYDIINGEEKLIYFQNGDYPYGYSIIKRDILYLIRLGFNESNLKVSGIVEWNPNKRDTISLEMVQQSEHVKRLIKIKYNGDVVWDEETASNTDNRYFQIVK